MVTKSHLRARNGDGVKGKLVFIPLSRKEQFGV